MIDGDGAALLAFERHLVFEGLRLFDLLDFIAERAKARGLSEQDYMSGNLLRREVTADDVAQAFLHQAIELKTTGDVTTVDGGNIAAALR